MVGLLPRLPAGRCVDVHVSEVHKKSWFPLILQNLCPPPPSPMSESGAWCSGLLALLLCYTLFNVLSDQSGIQQLFSLAHSLPVNS